MKSNKLISNTYFLATLFIIAGFFLGWLVFHRSSGMQKPATVITEKKATIWTCSMHPQIRKEEPGQCPLCGMDLIPLSQDATQIDPNAISMTEDAAKIAEVQTMTVSTSGKAVKQVRLYGKIESDERSFQTQSAHLAGRIEQLFVNFTGEEVTRGQKIAEIYSPQMITAQQELFEALKMADTAIIAAARDKLKQWKLTDSQISTIEKNGQVRSIFDITATVSGVVTARKVNKGDYVQQGSPLFEISDLSQVWAMFDAYETDLPWIKKGDMVHFRLQSIPGKEFSGAVTFIDPMIASDKRVARVRVNVDNSGRQLKPGMFATGEVNAQVKANKENFVIPHSAILWTGTRSIVYLKVQGTAQPTFLMREITLGPDLGDSYVVEEGLEDGDEIVTNGTFNIDASAQLMGKPSMMNGITDTAKMPEAVKKVDAGPELQAQIDKIFMAYDKMKNAFVESDPKKAAAAAEILALCLKSTDIKTVGNAQKDLWNSFTTTAIPEVGKISGGTDVEKQRESFSKVSNALYKVIRVYGSGQTVYYQYCPMAFGNKGAYWLSEAPKISNPYFGQAMLTCGETREKIIK